LLSNIKVPEVIALLVRVRQARLGHPNDSLSDLSATLGSIAKPLPVIKPTASDYVIDCGKCPFRMI